MKPEEFVKTYEAALGTQNWKMVEPLIVEHASVTFSTGVVHAGIKNVKEAFESNFEKIKNEAYSIEKINWVAKEDAYAVYTFEYNWKGIVAGKLMSGGGIGTAVIIRVDEKWKLLTEHLGKKA